MKHVKIMIAALVLGLTMGLSPKMSWAGNVAVGVFLGIPFPAIMVEAPPVYVHSPYAYTAYPYTYVTPAPVRAYYPGFPFFGFHSYGYYHGKRSGYHGRPYGPVHGGQKGHGQGRPGHHRR